jgi:hypothetical protein
MQLLKSLAAATLVAAFTAPLGGAAQAQEGAWCAFAGGRNAYENCGYYTLDQCRAAVSGVGGACMPNPRGGYSMEDRRGGYYDDPPPRRRVRPAY